MKLENAKGIIRIRFDGFLSCLFIRKPKVVDWPDCGGTVARYYACFPFDQSDNALRIAFEDKVSAIGSIEDLLASGFMDLLEDGEYDFELWKEKTTHLLFNTNLIHSNEIIYSWSKRSVGEQRVADISLNNFYPYARQLMFTQPFENLDFERIKYYENKILSGERPLAIALRVKRTAQDDEDSYQDTDFNTTKYVLDGHHKLVAYKNLGINPSYIVINRIQRGNLEGYDESPLPEIEPYLFYYQIENILNNGISTMHISPNLTEYIDAFLRKSSRLKDKLAKSLYQHAHAPGYENSEERRKWFAQRLEILINRIEAKDQPFHLDYYCKKDNFRKFVQVTTWQEVIALME